MLFVELQAGKVAEPDAATLSLLDADGEMRPLDEIERAAIRFAIAHYRGQMSEVARRLQIGRSTLYRKMEDMEPGTGAADVVAVGCPFCMTMLEDGINARKGERDVRVMDVAELLWQSAQK